MVEATDDAARCAALGIGPVNQADALGLFRQEELTTHVGVVLEAYLKEAENIAKVSGASV